MSDLGADALLGALERAGSDLAAWVAVLWTWLEPRLADLEDRVVKTTQIRAEVLAAAVPRAFDLPAELTSLAAGDVLDGAARLLARIDCWTMATGRPDTVLAESSGIDGKAYVVCTRGTWLLDEYWRGDKRARHLPPAADYPPAMAVLARQLVVVPVEHNGLSLKTLGQAAPDDVHRALNRVRGRFESLRAAPGPDGGRPFRVHFAGLGPNEAAGYSPLPGGGRFVYQDPEDPEVCERVLDQVRVAVETAAAKSASILLVPELALPATCLDQVKEAVLAADPAPVLTVVGLRHVAVAAAGESSESDDKPLSPYANEVVVLADDGAELFRHRKLTAYVRASTDPDGPLLEEDTRLGRSLTVVPTPVGNICVITCLDSFGRVADRVRSSHGTVLLVPSLSATVAPHRTSLADVVRVLPGVAFVCNRVPFPAKADDEARHTRSFWTAALMNGCVDAPVLSEEPATAVFDLDEHRGMAAD